jgi:hypothetical protein
MDHLSKVKRALRRWRVGATLVLVLSLPAFLPRVGVSQTVAGKGVNYETGNGTDQLNCDSGNLDQLHKDMQKLRGTDLQWVRIETYRTLPDHPSCRRLGEFEGLANMISAVEESKSKPLLDILGYEYSAASREAYLLWLNSLLDRFPQITAFEIGNEENLSNVTESYPGSPAVEFPYGWKFRADDYRPSDFVGDCPTDAVKNADLEQAVSSYTDWLADTYAAIKQKRPDAVVVIGGLSSYQPKCWTKKLGEHHAYDYADAIAYHPYGNTPQDGTATLDYLAEGMKDWPKQLPVWVTEFGFTTVGNSDGSTPTEARKAEYLTEQFNLLSSKVAGPILYWTAHDAPLTTAAWVQQCSYVICLQGDEGPEHIPGTDDLVSGAGLFEWLDGKFVDEPSYEHFAELRRRGCVELSLCHD